MQILLWIQENLRCPILDDIFIFITSLGNAGAVWIAITLILLIIPKTRGVGIMSAMGLLLSLIVNNGIIKNVVGRERPYDAVPELINLIGRQVDASFPSGHTASSFVSAVVILRNLPKKIGVPAIILAVLIAFSRLYVGVHYPSDVLFGIGSGILLAIVSELIYKKFIRSCFGK